MILYALLLFTLVVLYPHFKKKVVLSQGRIIELNNIYICIVSFILISVLGLRGLSVGIDTNAYYNSFNDIKLLNLSQALDVEVEHGYRLFQFIIGRIFGDYQYLLIIVAIIYISVISYFIYKYSQNPMLSYILFIVFGFYSFAMSTTRQTIAIALIMVAFKFIKEKSILKFMFFVFLASSFHMTSLIFLPSYWFNKLKFNKKTVLFFVLIALAVIVLKDELVVFLTRYARIDYGTIETGGNRMYLFMLISVLLGIIYRKPFIARDENNKYFFYMMVASVIIMPVTQFHPAVMRLYYYFFIFMIIYIPNILSVINDKMIRFIGISGYLITGVIFFFSHMIHAMQLEKYLFFWQ